MSCANRNFTYCRLEDVLKCKSDKNKLASVLIANDEASVLFSSLEKDPGYHANFLTHVKLSFYLHTIILLESLRNSILQRSYLGPKGPHLMV